MNLQVDELNEIELRWIIHLTQIKCLDNWLIFEFNNNKETKIYCNLLNKLVVERNIYVSEEKNS